MDERERACKSECWKGVNGAAAEGRSNIILAKCCWIMSNGVSASAAVATEIFSFAFYCHIALLRRDDDAKDFSSQSAAINAFREKTLDTVLSMSPKPLD